MGFFIIIILIYIILTINPVIKINKLFPIIISMNPIRTIRVYCIHRIIRAVCIQAEVIVLLRQRILLGEHREYRVVLACAVVIQVESVHAVQFLAVVLVRLQTAVRALVGEEATEGIVVRDLLHRPALVHHGTVVAQVVLRIVVEQGLYSIA